MGFGNRGMVFSGSSKSELEVHSIEIIKLDKFKGVKKYWTYTIDKIVDMDMEKGTLN